MNLRIVFLIVMASSISRPKSTTLNWVKLSKLKPQKCISGLRYLKAILRDSFTSAPSIYIFFKQIFFSLHKQGGHTKINKQTNTLYFLLGHFVMGQLKGKCNVGVLKKTTPFQVALFTHQYLSVSPQSCYPHHPPPSQYRGEGIYFMHIIIHCHITCFEWWSIDVMWRWTKTTVGESVHKAIPFK